jgi:hypothetical protein
MRGAGRVRDEDFSLSDEKLSFVESPDERDLSVQRRDG